MPLSTLGWQRCGARRLQRVMTVRRGLCLLVAGPCMPLPPARFLGARWAPGQCTSLDGAPACTLLPLSQGPRSMPPAFPMSSVGPPSCAGGV